MTPTHSNDLAPLHRLLSRLTGDEKHNTGAHSTLHVLWALYSRVLRIEPDNPHDELRDRFYLSKGHGPHAYYAVLAAHGFINPDMLDSFGSLTSPLGHHPDRTLVPGVEIASGSLGHGLGLAIGAYRALQAKRLTTPRLYVLIGDGELDEGSNMEAIQVAGRLRMERLTVIVIDNNSSTYGWNDSIGSRFEVEGWVSSNVNGQDVVALATALNTAHDRPHVVVAHTERSAS
ncbi:MAG TPA: transketolase [Actinobacteria bacterium]|nr:ferredoxin fas2 [bacterium BMS3Bbin02]HDL42295.1 transketolase [Actinomycetota bacterium]